MSSIHVFWRERSRDFDSDKELDRLETHTGVLTADHEGADEESPVVIEDLTGRVYRAGDFPTNTVLYIEAAPGDLPPIAKVARQAGFQIAHAESAGLGRGQEAYRRSEFEAP